MFVIGSRDNFVWLTLDSYELCYTVNIAGNELINTSLTFELINVKGQLINTSSSRRGKELSFFFGMDQIYDFRSKCFTFSIKQALSGQCTLASFNTYKTKPICSDC